jgi:glucose-6-phosphate-specific signal transduction histidine kinase
MTEPVSAASIAAAALAMQFSIVVVMFAGAFLLGLGVRHSPFWREGRDTSGYLWFLVFFSLTTIGLLVISEEFSTTWAPLFGSSLVPGISWRTSLLLVFCANIGCVGVLIGATGGSAASPFAPLFFLMPPLAIFLRSPPSHVLLYSVLATVAFTVTLRQAPRDLGVSDTRWRMSSWFVAISCFALATFLGYITRPL